VLGSGLTVCSTPVGAFDGDHTFSRGTVIFSLEVGGGAQNNIEDHPTTSNLSFVNLTPRLSILPFDPVGSGWLHGALETGLEAWLQYYLHHHDQTAEGLKAAFRYHFLGLGALVPYIEVTAGAAGSSLRVMEIDSTLNFVLEGGLGVSYFVTDNLALTVGYRFQHISNGDTSHPNVGLESDTGTFGVSYFFH
jgi:lipid A 3-O-deacylase